MPSSDRPASTLLLGFVPRMGLAAARSLHQRGVRVIVATLADEETPVTSRAIARFVSFTELADDPAAFGEALRALITRERVDLVVPITDKALRCVAPHVADLRRGVIMACPSADVIDCVLNKQATLALAASVGVPIARSALWTADRAAAGAPAPLTFPIFAKSSKVGLQRVPTRARIDDLDALRALAVHSGAEKQFLLEEFIPGDDVGVAVLMRRGVRLATFQYRALRCVPAEGGVSVLTRSEPVDPALARCVERLLGALDWDGVAELDFRHDPATGRFVFLEINARFWGSLPAASAAGIDFPWALWELAHGRAPAPQRPYRIGSHAQSLDGELTRLLGLARQRRRHPWLLLRDALRVTWAACRPDVSGMIWSWRDPLPGFQTAGTIARCWIQTRWRNLRG